MHKASWVFLLAVSLMLTAGCKKDELRAKDARIAELEAQNICLFYLPGLVAKVIIGPDLRAVYRFGSGWTA